MKSSRFSDEQIVRILQEADNDLVAEMAKRHGVVGPSICGWGKKFGDLGTDDVKRVNQLEQVNIRFKRMVVERDLEIEVMKEIAATMVSVQARLDQVRYAIGRGVTHQRVCTLMEVARSGRCY